MGDYIKRDDVVQFFIEEALDEMPSCLKREIAEKVVDNMPKVDAVKVVRCKDCKYQPQAARRWDDDDTIATYVWCEEMCCADKDNYCPYGRKDGDDD